MVPEFSLFCLHSYHKLIMEMKISSGELESTSVVLHCVNTGPGAASATEGGNLV